MIVHFCFNSAFCDVLVVDLLSVNSRATYQHPSITLYWAGSGVTASAQPHCVCCKVGVMLQIALSESKSCSVNISRWKSLAHMADRPLFLVPPHDYDTPSGNKTLNMPQVWHHVYIILGNSFKLLMLLSLTARYSLDSICNNCGF